ncbi:MAG TPA: hypothetical protein PKA00_09985 [Saprospiraceae bacterium]|nr:hypothetical protein [Saprospiraceae bacterium]HMQ83227.1 hypothetical protein [Saprospiraceae bacterium]
MASEKSKPAGNESQPAPNPQVDNPVEKNNPSDLGRLTQILEKLLVAQNNTAQSVPTLATEEAENTLKEKLDAWLNEKDAVTVAFPPCSDVMLSLIKCTEYSSNEFIAPIVSQSDQITKMFLEYFGFIGDIGQPQGAAPNYTHKIILESNFLDEGWIKRNNWPPTWCLPASYVTLKGQRHFYTPKNKDGIYRTAKRLFLADVVWLFYMERMGTFQILGKILDEYAYNGGFPISNGSAIDGPKDDLLALVLEAMTRQMEMGTASKVRDRTALYRTALGWVLDNGRKLGLETNVNTAFNQQFHKFIYLALQYYKDQRIKDAIQASTTGSPNSGATMVSIRSTMNLLKKSFDNFHYGRNYYNTLSGIVWTVGAFAVIRDIRETIGIPTQYNEPYDYIPAMYERLVSKEPTKSSDVNRFETHFECATNARDILIDIELLETSASSTNDKDIETWLNLIETKVEGYRSAYRALTGVDLGITLVATQEPMIEQKA